MSMTNRAAVLLDLREEEQQLESDLAAVRAAIVGIEVLEKRTSTQSQLFGPPILPTPVTPSAGSVYAGLGTRGAIMTYMRSVGEPRFPAAIASALLEGGVVTKSEKFARMVTSTLAQMKMDGLVDSTPHGWILRDKQSNQGGS